MAEIHPTSVRNQLLAVLPGDQLARLLPRLTPTILTLRQTIYLADTPIDAVYFVESGMVSLVASLDEGVQGEVGVVGAEGMVGMPLVAGAETSFTEVMVQAPGSALRMGAAAFRQEIRENAFLRDALLLYGEAFQAQASQSAACNGRHALEQRLARWLLMAHDRAEGDVLGLTQEFLAMMLNVHRPSVTVTAGILQAAGFVRYAKGVITIIDRPGLEAASCECYRAVQRRYASLLKPLLAPRR